VSAPVVVFEGVSKKFRRGERHDSLRDLIPSLARRMLGRRASRELESPDDFWAVRDVSFEVARGEALGIIGPNGAGKSTTLKLLTRILKPTQGTCLVRGRVGALIEVAAGFHPDLTGRENIFLQGAIMGMRRPEIIRKLDAIIDFAGVSDFIDTPVKRYSSGMNARLGFSIAANLEPDALIIDEVLSVGDMAFQQRCVDRMADFKRNGVSIVFVSHNLQAIASLCDRALFLKRTAEFLGPPLETIQAYLHADTKQTFARDTDQVRIVDAQIVDLDGRAVSTFAPGTKAIVRAQYVPRCDADDVTFGFIVHRSTDNLLLYDGNFTNAELGLDGLRKGVPISIDFLFDAHLTRGQYHVLLHVYHNPTQKFLTPNYTVGGFTIVEHRTWSGIVDLAVEPTIVSENRSRAPHSGTPRESAHWK
jgi:lipopolysaccharide transport system ATP-binding protein